MLVNFWHGELPPSMRTPGQPHHAVLAWEFDDHGGDIIHTFYLSPSRLSDRRIAPAIAALGSRQRFEELRFQNLLDGFFSVPDPLHAPPMFDSGHIAPDLACRMNAAQPSRGMAEEIALLRGRQDWSMLPAWPLGRRLLLQLGPRSADLLPFGVDAQNRQLWNGVWQQLVLGQIKPPLVEALEENTPVMLIDVIKRADSLQLCAIDLLAYAGADIRAQPFVERQRLLQQEINELHGAGLRPQLLQTWLERTGSDMAAANESAYGLDLLSAEASS